MKLAIRTLRISNSYSFIQNQTVSCRLYVTFPIMRLSFFYDLEEKIPEYAL